MEGWVAEWIKMRRSAGEKCLEVKYIPPFAGENYDPSNLILRIIS